MKKLFLTLFSLSLIILFSSCKDENLDGEEKIIKPFKNFEVSYEEADSTAAEISRTHDYVISQFLLEIYTQNDVFDESYYNKFYDFMVSELGKQEFNYIDKASILDVDYKPKYSNIDMIANSDLQTIFNNLSLYGRENLCERSLSIDVYFDDLVKKFDNDPDYYFEDFEVDYRNHVTGLIVGVDIDDYLYTRIESDVNFGSFVTWTLYKHNLLFSKGTKQQSMNSLKGKLSATWNQVKPVAKADAKGALTGAITGAVTGGLAGLGAGAISNGCFESAYKCVENLFGW